MAEVKMNAAEYRRLVQIITDKAAIRTENERDLLLESAGLQKFASRLHPGTQANVFSAELVSLLQHYGNLTETNEPALVSLLCYVRQNINWDKPDADFLDALLAPYQPCGDEGSDGPIPSGKVQILFLAANPRDTPPLRLGAEIRTIQERLNAVKLRDRFNVAPYLAVRYSDLSQYLLTEAWQIVHFSGHSTESSEIVLEEDSGNGKIIPEASLTGLFKIVQNKIRVVVFNACWSEKQARAISQEIDCTIGMTQPINDDAAISFAAGFYRGIGFGLSVQKAFELGKNELSVAMPSNADVPRLLCKPGIDADKIVL